MRIKTKIDLSNIELNQSNKKITFIRIDPEEISDTIKKIYDNISDVSWINKFDKEYIRESYQTRANKTINDLSLKIKNGEDDKVTSETGEYFVSELSREALIDGMGYLDIPLAEIRKEETSGNPGFDFHSETDNQVVIFGEAKYLNKKNAYTTALKQIVRFIEEKKDVGEIVELENFVSGDSLINFSNGKKGYAAGFSSTTMSDDLLVNNILQNENLKLLLNYEEVILVAVDING